MKKEKNNRTNFIEFIFEFLSNISPAGRKRILKDLIRTSSKILCTNDSIKSVSQIGSPSVSNILKRLEEFTNYTDQDIKWEKTEGVKFDIIETRNAVKYVLLKLEQVYHQRGADLTKLFLSQLSKQNDTLLRKLSVLTYRSNTPGSKLVGKQTKLTKNAKIGYVYEHTVPVKFLITEILNLFMQKKTKEKIDYIFTKLISVELNTDHDNLILTSGLKDKMPDGWTWEMDPLERYWTSGIKKDSISKI